MVVKKVSCASLLPNLNESIRAVNEPEIGHMERLLVLGPSTSRKRILLLFLFKGNQPPVNDPPGPWLARLRKAPGR